MRDQLIVPGLDPAGNTPDELARLAGGEIVKQVRLVKSAGIAP